MEIKKINPIEYVASHPEIFLVTDIGVLPELASKLALDSIALECTPLIVDRHFDWWLVSSKKNWLTKGHTLSINDLFSSLVPFPIIGQNSNRNEILINAYCKNVCVSSEGVIYFIKGAKDDQFLNFLTKNYEGQTCVAFKGQSV